MSVEIKEWGKLPDGKAARLYTFAGETVSFTISDYGGIITSIIAPDKSGNLCDVALGYDTLEEYIKDDAYVGAMVGRVANRIDGAQFTLNEVEYKLTANEGQHHLHGGGSFNKRLWDVEEVTDNGIFLRLHSPDGDDGYPGNINAEIRVCIDKNCINMAFSAVSDKDTFINMTNHTYFNLRGTGDILNHKIKIDADRVTPTNEKLIPTGEIKPVIGTIYDFREMRTIERPEYDINYVLNADGLAAEVFEPESGRILRVYADMPCVQFYAGCSMTERKGKNGQEYGKNSGFCLEPQYFPNGANQPGFNGGLLMAGQGYNHSISFEITV